MTGISFEEICYDLAEETGKESYLIQNEIEALSEAKGIPRLAAVAVWKTQNRRALNKGVYDALILDKSAVNKYTKRDGSGQGQVANIAFLARQDGEATIKYNYLTLWDSAVDETYPLVDAGGFYSLRASMGRDGLYGATDIEAIDPQDFDMALLDAVLIDDLDASRENLREKARGLNTMIKGWVGGVRKTQGSEEIIGFEVWDSGNTPITVWFAGQYSRISPERIAEIQDFITDGAEIAAHGYVGKEGDLSMNASDVFIIE